MIEEKFSNGNSVIHQIDLRIKVISAFLFSIIIALSSKYIVLASGFIFSTGLIFFARLKLKEVLKRILMVNFFILLLWLILPFSVSGKTLFSIWKLNATEEGILYATQITIKCNTIILAIISLLSTSSILNLTYALKSLYVPDKIVYLFFLIYRYIFNIFREYKRIEKALKARGFVPKTSIYTYRTYAYVVGNLLIRSYERAEQVYRAMLCRGFKGKFWTLSNFSFKTKDFVFAGITGFYISFLLILQWMKF